MSRHCNKDERPLALLLLLLLLLLVLGVTLLLARGVTLQGLNQFFAQRAQPRTMLD